MGAIAGVRAVAWRWVRADLLAVAGVVTLAVAANLGHALHDALWQDEVASARIIEQPTALAVLHNVRLTESTPPLWYLLAWAVHRVGLAVVDVRLLSLVATGGTAAAVVLLGRRMMPIGLAALAGLLVAIGSQFAAQSHDLRAYALLVLLTVLLAAALDAEVGEPTLRHEAALAGCVAAGLLTHYFFVFSVVAAIGWLLFEPEANAVRRRTFLTMAAGAAVFLAFFSLAFAQYRHDRFWWIGPFDLRMLANTPFRLIFPVTSHQVGELVPAGLLALAAFGGWRLGRRSRRGRLVAVLAFGPLLACGVAWYAGIRIFAFRNLVETGPFFALVICGAIAALPRRLVVLAAGALAAAAVVGYIWSQRGAPTPYNRIAEALVAEGWRANDPIALYGSFFAFRSPLEWYLPNRPPLALGKPTGNACSTLFIVEQARRSQAAALDVGGFLVKRLLVRGYPAMIRSLQGATLLTDPIDPAPCTRPVMSGRFSAAYGIPTLRS